MTSYSTLDRKKKEVIMKWIAHRSLVIALASGVVVLALWATPGTVAISMPLASGIAASGDVGQALICASGPQTITGTVLITAPCTVTGNLIIDSGGTLFVNYRGFSQNHFMIKGDLVVKGNGKFYFAGGVLEFQQDFRSHREIRTWEQALLFVADAQILTSQNTENKFMYLWARGFSTAIFLNTELNPSLSWLIAQMSDSSVVRVSGSNLVPTEIYLRDKTSASVQSSVGLTCWMELNNQSLGRIELPVQADANDMLIPYDYHFGRDSPNVSGVDWQLDILDSKVNLGVESGPYSAFRVIGRGKPMGGELKVSYAIISGTHTFDNLGTGLVNTVMGNGRLILQNVQLGLIAWQMYVRDADVLIKNSVINEIGVDTNARVRVENSVLQLASLASLGSGSMLEIYGSKMYNQGIDVHGNGRLIVENTAVHGTSFRTYEPGGFVRIINSAFLRNALDCTFTTMFDTLGGEPRCNAFIPQGAAPTKSGPGTMTCVGTSSCAW